MSGIYGTVKPANIDIENDVQIFYSYNPNRGYNNNLKFEEINASNLIHATDGQTTIDGLYNLKLPLSIFGKKGVYTVYIKPKEISTKIYGVGNLYEYDDIRGVIFEKKSFEGTGLASIDNDLVGYRIEYGNFTRLITSSNLCSVITVGRQDKYRLYNGNTNLVFCTVTPSTANSFTPNDKPDIGYPQQEVKIVNTKFSPIMFEIEMVDHDLETLSYMIEGSQVRNLDNGMFTIYNDNNEIYKQYDTFTIKTRLGKPLYDVKAIKNTIDTSESYNNIIGEE